MSKLAHLRRLLFSISVEFQRQQIISDSYVLSANLLTVAVGSAQALMIYPDLFMEAQPVINAQT